MFAPMLRIGLATALAALCVGLAGCEEQAKADAAEAAGRLLAAAQSADRVRFEAEIDRAAVREDLRRQIVEVARADGLEVDGGPSDLALDRMISPEAVRKLAPTVVATPPGPKDLAQRLDVVGKRRMCLPDPLADDRCLFTFAKEKEAWRLVGMQALDLPVRIASAETRSSGPAH